VCHEPPEQTRLDAAGSGDPSVEIGSQRTAGQARHEAVDQDIAGTGVESPHSIKTTAFRQKGEVGDSTEVQDDPVQSRVSKQEGMQIGSEWSPLAASGQISGTEVCHGRYAGPLGDDRRLADLQRRANRHTVRSLAIGKVGDRLPVGADKGDTLYRHASLPNHRNGRFRKQLPEVSVQVAELAGAAARVVRRPQDPLAKPGREGKDGEVQKPKLREPLARTDLENCGVAPVCRRPGHKANDLR